MALPPTIPTSFVPKQPVLTRKSTIGFNPFLVVAYFVLGIWILVAFLVFGYQLYLEKIAKQRADDLITAQNNIDQATVTDFIRLRDRFTTAKTVLDKHVTLSHFFDNLENITVQNARFTSLKITVKDTRTASIEMAGVAKNFNALAAQSTAFANDKRFKRAIFSGFVLDQKDGTVKFEVKADVESSLVTETAASVAAPPVQPVGTSTPPAAPITP